MIPGENDIDLSALKRPKIKRIPKAKPKQKITKSDLEGLIEDKVEEQLRKLEKEDPQKAERFVKHYKDAVKEIRQIVEDTQSQRRMSVYVLFGMSTLFLGILVLLNYFLFQDTSGWENAFLVGSVGSMFIFTSFLLSIQKTREIDPEAMPFVLARGQAPTVEKINNLVLKVDTITTNMQEEIRTEMRTIGIKINNTLNDFKDSFEFMDDIIDEDEDNEEEH